MDVFRLTLEISKQCFPVLLDVENPAFLRGLQKIQKLAVRIDEAKQNGGAFGKLRAVGMAGSDLLHLREPLSTAGPEETSFPLRRVCSPPGDLS